MKTRRRGGLAAWAALLSCAWMVGCGSSSNSNTTHTEQLPITGTKAYQVAALSGGSFNTPATLEIQNLGNKAWTTAGVKVWLTTADGRFSHTALTVTALRANHIEATATVSGVVYNITIDLTNAGGNVTLKVVVNGVTSQGAGIQIGDAPATGDTADATKMAAATAALTQLLTDAAHNQAVTKARVQAVETAYAAARATAVNDPKANFGWAISHLAVAARNAAEAAGAKPEDLDFTPGDITVPHRVAMFPLRAAAGMVTPGGLVNAVAESGNIVTTQGFTPLTAALPGSTSAARGRVTYGNDKIDDAKIEQQIRTVLLPALVESRAAMGKVMAATAFNYAVSFKDSNNDDFNLVFGPAEAKTVAAALDAVTGATQMTLIYQITGTNLSIFNSDLWDWMSNAPPKHPWTITAAAVAKSQLAPADYLPAAPFATLQSDGTARSRAALAALQAATVELSDAWTVINAANKFAGQSLDTIFTGSSRSRALSAADRTKATKALNVAKLAFAGQYTIDYAVLEEITGRTIDADVKDILKGTNVPAFWSNPPADFRSILPTLSVVARASGITGSFVGGKADVVCYVLGTYETWGGPAVTGGSFPLVGGLITAGGLFEPGLDWSKLEPKLHYNPVAVSDTAGAWRLGEDDMVFLNAYDATHRSR